MSTRQPLVFKTATEDREFEQIHRLNYKTFAEEIPQHHPSPAQRLVDKFHAENTYLICLSGNKLVGMLAVRGNRPFSLDQKLENVDSYLPAGRNICEIRLLAVEKRFRGAQVLQGILALLWQHGIEKGYDLAIISGTPRQFRLYQHLGFVPFGPVVGADEAQFQPMYVTLETFEATAREFLRSSPSRSFHPSAVNFLPGPVTVRREVRRLFERNPSPGWVWCAHCETSTGILNDLERLKVLCSEFRVKLCLDCISSIGTLPVDLRGVFLASCASGKGLRSYPGVSMVFYHHDLGSAPSALPRYLDLRQYAAQSIPFTFSSNLLHALHAALKRVAWERRFREIQELSVWLR